MSNKRALQQAIGLAIVVLLLVGCGTSQSAPTPIPLTTAPLPPRPKSVPPTDRPLPPAPRPFQSVSPAARGYHVMAYDAESDRIVLFGGGLNPESFLKVTWAYDFETNIWQDMPPAQSPPAGEGPMAYDIQSDRTILFRGTLRHKPGGETWAYDFNTNVWKNMGPTETPFGLVGAQMAYDAESDRMILFGGVDANVFGTGQYKHLNGTWAYDYDSNTWTKMEPEVSPRGLSFHAMAYDHSSDRVILFGGVKDTVTSFWALQWSYDYNTDTWEELKPDVSPSARHYCKMVYDPGSDRMILFGGAGMSGDSPLSDTWAYHFATNTWTELEPDTSLSERGWHAAVYSSEAEQIVLFGGGRHRYAFTDETWVYDPEANKWTNAAPSP